jgi:CRISP-associated protein Cas1
MSRKNISSTLLFLDQSGVALQVRRSALCVRKSDGTETQYPARVHNFRTVILAGHGASITSEAVRWLAREQVACYLMERSGEAFAVLSSAVEIDGRRRALALRQKQFAAVLDPRKRMGIARKIVRAKIATLGLHPADARSFRADLQNARKLDDILTCEARAGAAYFMRWRGAEIRFVDEAPAHWKVFTARAASLLRGKGGTSRARHAATPFGACLNYAFTVALGQCTRAIIGAGLDPCFGFLHSPKPGRLSLSYDVLELHRGTITTVVFGYLQERSISPEDFELTQDGIVRLNGLVAREIATLALRAVPIVECVASVRRVAAWF